MLYCFVEKSLNMKMNEELRIQANYAIKLGCFIMLTNDGQSIVDENYVEIDIVNKLVFIRTDYEHITDAMKCVVGKGGILFENHLDRLTISTWPFYYKPRREIVMLENLAVSSMSTLKGLNFLSHSQKQFFFKSVSKGINKILVCEDLINPTSELFQELNRKGISIDSQFMLSEQISICKDRYGDIEVRFIVIDNTIINYSRYFHSLNHEIEDLFISKANEIVATLAPNNDFPDNYVLDLAKIYYQNENFIDVIEFNPLSTSLCYVNNSIFRDIIPEINEIKKTWSFGAEYCLDMISSPNGYIYRPSDCFDPTYST